MGLNFSTPSVIQQGRWRLDAIGILAILGERNVKLNSLLITSNGLCYFPRLMPAPQGILSGKRMKRLPQEEDVTVVGIKSGNKQTGLNYFASMIHAKILDAPEFTVQTIDIRTRFETPEVLRQWCCPIDIITGFSCLLTVGLLGYALYLKDGIGFFAVLVMSISTTLICAAAHWRVRLPRRTAPRRQDQMPPGDVVIRTTQGSFLVIRCEEAIARKLYFAKEDCEYSLSTSVSMTVGGFGGGIGLSAAIILYGNCTWGVQAATASAYAGLNLLYWIASACPPQWTWDWSQFGIFEIRPAKTYSNFTAALAMAIRDAGDAQWAYTSEAAPQNASWRTWCDKADIMMGTDSWWKDWTEDRANAPKDDSHFQGALTMYLENPPITA
jgi:hypothetical protein